MLWASIFVLDSLCFWIGLSLSNKNKIADRRIQIHQPAAIKSLNKKSPPVRLAYFLDHLDLAGVTETRFVFIDLLSYKLWDDQMTALLVKNVGMT